MSFRDLRLPLGIALAGGIGFAACGGNSSPTGPDSAVVSYSVSDSGLIAPDDLSYDDGTGTLVLVSGPGNSFTRTLTLPLPASIEGVLHGHGTGGGKLKFRVQWTIDGQLHGDSAETTATSGSFTLSIPHHSI